MNKTTGLKLKKIRERADINLPKLAQLMKESGIPEFKNITRQTINKYEKGLSRIPFDVVSFYVFHLGGSFDEIADENVISFYKIESSHKSELPSSKEFTLLSRLSFLNEEAQRTQKEYSQLIKDALDKSSEQDKEA